MRRNTIIHSSAVVESCARIGTGTTVGPNSFIGKLAQIGAGSIVSANAIVGDGVRLGKQCIVGPGASIRNCTADDRVVFKAGCRVGEDGFGFHPAGTVDKEKIVKKPQTLRVWIESDVEIGANATVDRGSWRDTRVGQYTKIDNLVQVGHNVHIGKNCLIAAQSGIAGSVTIGDRVMMGGQSGVAQHVKIGEGCQIAAKSGVTADLAPGSKVGGMPAVNIIQFHRSFLERFPRSGSHRKE
jgi:UDP-3-O-[3-hydroxymyristoyl] glucosamine N-acyltransferase